MPWRPPAFISRIQVFDEADLPNVIAMQNELKIDGEWAKLNLRIQCNLH